MTPLLQRIARGLFTIVTGVCLDTQQHSIAAAEARLEVLRRENEELRSRLLPTAGTVMQWRGRAS